MKTKRMALMLVAVAAIIGALVIIPTFAQTAEPEPEAEWYPPCGNWDGEAWTFEEGVEPPCYDPETGE